MMALLSFVLLQYVAAIVFFAIALCPMVLILPQNGEKSMINYRKIELDDDRN